MFPTRTALATLAMLLILCLPHCEKKEEKTMEQRRAEHMARIEKLRERHPAKIFDPGESHGKVVKAGDDSDEELIGTDGNDEVIGGSGTDVIRAGEGADRVRGGDGNDRLFGEGGNDELFGSDGDDYMDGGPGDDVLWGQDGNDTLRGGPGADTISGIMGADTFVWLPGDLEGGVDVFDGFDASDVIDVSALLAEAGYQGDGSAESLKNYLRANGNALEIDPSGTGEGFVELVRFVTPVNFEELLAKGQLKLRP
ncbi:MAG: hypothetical protein KDH09_20265 [Chrysiogenetes bacterium]|nr:hypothetical protein [Chrysiogenetes bacterium]